MVARKARSGKRSSGKSAERPKKFTACLDASLSCVEVMEAFDKEKIKYKRHTDYAKPNTHDDTWLPRVGKNRWVLLTTDDSMQYRVAEARAIRAFKVRSFVIRSQMRGQDIARFLVKNIARMRRFCGNHEAPFIAFVKPSGEIKLVMDSHGLVNDHLKSAL